MYYLSDNSQDDLYAYLLIVRTENRRNAGTTSNVMVRLSGTKGSSEVGTTSRVFPSNEIFIATRTQLPRSETTFAAKTG